VATAEEAQEVFARLVPKLTAGPATGRNINLDDPTLAGLRLGKAVKRFNWEHVYPDAALRAMPKRAAKQPEADP
jgi:hypothetical protein